MQQINVRGVDEGFKISVDCQELHSAREGGEDCITSTDGSWEIPASVRNLF